MAPFILLACLLFSYFAAALMFDAMISFFVALGFLGLVRAWKTQAGAGGFALLSLGLGGALYAKGPVALLHLLPLALFAPWWMREHRPRWGRWYGGVLLALLGGAAMILAWAIPAGFAGGDEYRNAIFWGQTAGRMEAVDGTSRVPRISWARSRLCSFRMALESSVARSVNACQSGSGLARRYSSSRREAGRCPDSASPASKPSATGAAIDAKRTTESVAIAPGE